jgi:hypothetical protein
MMVNEPLAPYDQNKLSNHKLSIAKPLEHVKIIYVIFFKNIAINHGDKSRLSRAKPNKP